MSKPKKHPLSKPKGAGKLKGIIEKLDASAPKIDEVDWSIMDMVMNNTDFTTCKNTMESFNRFYEVLWGAIVFPARDQEHLLQREVGRLILENDQHKRRADAAEETVETLREKLQGLRPEEAEGGGDLPLCQGSSSSAGDPGHNRQLPLPLR